MDPNRRPGITTKLKWDINEQHSPDVGYWYERARQLQTQPFISIKGDGNPSQIWGQPGGSDQVKDANGNTVQGRNQYTITPAQKVWLQDTVRHAGLDLRRRHGLSVRGAQRGQPRQPVQRAGEAQSHLS